MRHARFLSRLVVTLSLAVTPAAVSAQAGTGGFAIQNFFLNLILSFVNVWVPVAVMIVVIAGFTLMLSQSEEALDKAKKTILSVVTGSILLTIFIVIGPVNAVSSLYNGLPGIAIINSGAIFAEEAEGVAGWLTALSAMVGVIIIIIGVVRAATSFGGDEAAYTNVRTSMLQVILGLIVIAGAYVLREVFFTAHEPSAMLAFVATKILFVLGFIALIAVAILVFAGLRMIIGFGRDEEYTAAKSLALRVIVGLVVVIFSYAIVLTVALIFT